MHENTFKLPKRHKLNCIYKKYGRYGSIFSERLRKTMFQNCVIVVSAAFHGNALIERHQAANHDFCMGKLTFILRQKLSFLKINHSKRWLNLTPTVFPMVVRMSIISAA